MKKFLLVAFTFLFSAGMAQAQPLHRQPLKAQKHGANANIRATQKQQQQRIAKGIRSGKLTPREAAQLERQQARVQHQKRIARADGRITAQERMRIKKHQRIASRQIYMKKHNRRYQR